MPLTAVQFTAIEVSPAVAVTPVTRPGLVRKSASVEALVSSEMHWLSLYALNV